MSDNPDTITALARLEDAERENQKLRSERLLAEHARDEAQREAITARDLAAIAQRQSDDLRAQLASAEAELAAPITEESLRRRNGGALPVGKGCEIAVRGTTERAEAAEVRARDAALDRDMNDYEAGYFRRTCLELEARLRAVIEAGDDAFAALERRVHNASADWSAFAEAKRRYLSARSADLPPHPDEERMDFLQTLDCDSPLWQSFADSMFIRQAIDAARAQAGKEGA